MFQAAVEAVEAGLIGWGRAKAETEESKTDPSLGCGGPPLRPLGARLGSSPSCSLLQETINGLTSQLEAFQAKMKRVEESILSRDYKKHIQVGGSTPGDLSFWNLQGGQVLGNRKGPSLFKDKAQT